MKSFLLGVGTVVVHLDRKLLAKSFLLSVGAVVSQRDRKLFAKGFPIERKDNVVHRDGPPSFSLSLVILY